MVVRARITTACILAGVLAIAGCTTTGTSPPPVEQAEAAPPIVCPEDRAPMCQERMGRPVHCVCAGREELDDLIGLERL